MKISAWRIEQAIRLFDLDPKWKRPPNIKYYIALGRYIEGKSAILIEDDEAKKKT